ncbi:MAG: pilus assembly protein PilM [Chitinispirillia bacterium]|nr:pilus assembly protein PilM [Chitinispirillia bacterium]MCL2241701.1 pilus assembly protein PilM [Chitinispirillia bacterium]
MGKKQTFVGFELDAVSIRGARLSMEQRGKGGQPEWRLLTAEEVTGDLFEDAQALVALKKLKEKLGVQTGDRVSICLGGKAVYAVQMDVRRLPDNEMAGMLKLELRKSMPFEASAASFDYQFLPVGEDHPKDAGIPVMVSAAANSFLNRYVSLYDRAGLRPYHVDVLPISIANAFWASKAGAAAKPEDTHLILHVGSDVCTLVIDGGKSPFFTRSFSFNIGQAIGSAGAAGEGGAGIPDILLQMNVLSSEITKSVTYYKNTYQGGAVSTITVMGNHASHPAFDALGQKMGYEVQTVETAGAVLAVKPPEAGKYDLAVTLAMQAA